MIEIVHGDLLKADVEALVNAVNCVGVMGKGIAAQFKLGFPANFAAYETACKKKEVRLGKMFVFATLQDRNPKFIINFPTKKHWKKTSHMDDIQSGLDALATEVKQRGIRSIAIPPIGCGLGGLAWIDVLPKITEVANKSMAHVRVLIYEPINL